MLTRIKAEGNKVTIEIPAAWVGRELEIDIRPVDAAESIISALDKVTGGKRIDMSDWKCNQEELYDRKALRQDESQNEAPPVQESAASESAGLKEFRDRFQFDVRAQGFDRDELHER
jgi:hypothetical protein